MIMQQLGRRLVTAFCTACTVPSPTSEASTNLCSFASIRLKMGWFRSCRVIGCAGGLQPSWYGRRSSSVEIVQHIAAVHTNLLLPTRILRYSTGIFPSFGSPNKHINIAVSYAGYGLAADGVNHKTLTYTITENSL